MPKFEESLLASLFFGSEFNKLEEPFVESWHELIEHDIYPRPQLGQGF